jgi:hypothetical protein
MLYPVALSQWFAGYSDVRRGGAPNNDWGRIGDTREYLCRKLPELQDRLRAFGAIPIDARQPLDQVVDAILSHTSASPAAGRASKRSSQPGNPARP